MKIAEYSIHTPLQSTLFHSPPFHSLSSKSCHDHSNAAAVMTVDVVLKYSFQIRKPVQHKTLVQHYFSNGQNAALTGGGRISRSTPHTPHTPPQESKGRPK